MRQENENNFSRSTVAKTPFTYIQPDICTGCGACAEVCPMHAIKLENEIAVVIRDECSNCKICVSVCPEGAIM
ncbi:MAG: 4Fe-4S binding protein [Bacteroidales bacterium]|nr:4Fe-4S binding protein [Bacteroidales bacterium]